MRDEIRTDAPATIRHGRVGAAPSVLGPRRIAFFLTMATARSRSF